MVEQLYIARKNTSALSGNAKMMCHFLPRSDILLKRELVPLTSESIKGFLVRFFLAKAVLW